jgi:hypothetical protein
MYWIENAGIFLNRNALNWNWANQHNGDCLKIYSEKVKGLVESSQRCYNLAAPMFPCYLGSKTRKLIVQWSVLKAIKNGLQPQQ